MTSLDPVSLLGFITFTAGFGSMAIRFYTIMNSFEVVQTVVVTWNHMIHCIGVCAIA
jgi:hypothetical protein